MKSKKKFFFYLLLIIIQALILVSIYVGYTVNRTREIYWVVKHNQHGWEGIVHQPDAILGYVPIPNAKGAQVFPIGPDIPMRYDEDGFRIPVNSNDRELAGRPVALSLGGSYTYGYANYTEDTYSYLIGEHFKRKSINAGVCGYGLAQMFVLASELVPQYKPEHLIVQYSPWLVERALKPFGPTYFGKTPNPYFYRNGEKFQLHQPVFLTKKHILSIDHFRKSPKNIPDFISFF